MNKKAIALVIITLVVAVGFLSAYTVDEREQVVITQFGRIVGEPVTTPGLKFKIPFIQLANRFPKNLLEWDGDPGQIPTKEKTYIWVDSFARWKIVEPIKFFQTVSDVNRAQLKLNDIIDPAVRNFVTSYRLIETVRKSNRDLDTYEVGLEGSTRADARSYSVTTGREKITLGILQEAQPKLTQFGIKLVDVKIKRINYVEEVRKAVYNRMIAERKQIAEKYRSEGKGEAQKIRGQKEKKLKEITSEAYKTAQGLKGAADAESTKLYAEAYGVDPEFYSFIKSLEVYNESLDKDTSIIFSTDSEFLQYLKDYPMETETK